MPEGPIPVNDAKPVSPRELMIGCGAVGVVMLVIIAIVGGMVAWSASRAKQRPAGSSFKMALLGVWEYGDTTHTMTVDGDLKPVFLDSRTPGGDPIATGVLDVNGDTVHIHAVGAKLNVDDTYRLVHGAQADRLEPLGTTDPKLSDIWLREPIPE